MDTVAAAQASRVLIASVLFVAGVAKVRRISRFRTVLEAARLFSAPGVALILFGVPTFELLLPVWLLVAMDSKAPAWAAIALLGGFTAYILTLRFLGRDVPCGCLGGSAKVSDPFVLRNVGLAALAGSGVNSHTATYCLVAGLALLVAFAFSVQSAKRSRQIAAV
jgi:hypothetical protein